MSDKLLETYRSILKFAGLVADSEGYVSTVLGDQKEPALVNGLRLVLPTQQHLRTANPAEKIVFHPLSENILHGESEVLQKLTEVVNIRLNFTFGIVAQSLLAVVNNSDIHDSLKADCLPLLMAVKSVDDTCLTNFINVMLAGIKSRPTRTFVNIYLNRGGSLEGRRYSRVAVVSFPMWKELESNAEDIFGVKVRVKDRETFKQLYRFIFPNVEKNTYSLGSDSNTAPFLDVLMRSAMAVASPLNDLLTIYRAHIENSDKLVFDDAWVETFNNLDALIPDIRRIPTQFGNEGKAKITEAVGVVPAETLAKSLPVPQAQEPARPVAYAQPAAPVPQQPQAAQGLVKTSAGLDFRSIPGVQPPPQMYPGYPGYPQPGMQAPYPQTPRWGMPDPVPPQQVPPGYPQPYPQQMPPGYPQPYPPQVPPQYQQPVPPGYYQPQPYPQQMPPGYPQQYPPQQGGYPGQPNPYVR